MALPPYLYVFTSFFDIGLGVLSFFGICYFIPYIRRNAEDIEIIKVNTTTTSNPMTWFFSTGDKIRPFKLGKPIEVIVNLKKINHRFYNHIWLILLGTPWIALLGVEFLLLTAKSYTPNLYFDFLFARSSGLANGAHLSTYILIPLIGIFAGIKFKDAYLGLLLCTLLVAVHEGIWIIFYYAGYYQFLNWGLLINVIKDISFSIGLVILPILAFRKYPYQIFKLKEFKWVSVFILQFTTVWFVLGWTITGQPLPISVINNTTYGGSIYGQTQFWANPYVNFTEVISWIIPEVWFLTIIKMKRIDKE